MARVPPGDLLATRYHSMVLDWLHNINQTRMNWWYIIRFSLNRAVGGAPSSQPWAR